MKSIDSHGGAFAMAMMNNSADLARQINTASDIAIGAVSKSLKDLEQTSRAALEPECREDDPAESGIGDFDGYLEQRLRFLCIQSRPVEGYRGLREFLSTRSISNTSRCD